jgi:probable addiction module antidote protein
MRDRSHDDAMSELFAADPAFAANYLDNILEEGEPTDLLIALRQMANGFGGIAKVAHRSKLNPTQLYRTLSNRGNPEVRSLAAILHSMGLRLSVKQLPRRRTKSAARATVAVKSKRWRSDGRAR